MKIMTDKGVRYSLQVLFVTAAIACLVFLYSETDADAVAHDHFFAVHAEVMDTEQIEIQFNEGLRPMVHLANTYGIKLTISLSPQWAEYLLERPWLLYEIKQWLDEGHEIGMLHYGIRHEPEWDYYTNEISPEVILSAGRDPALKRGSMADLINIINTFLSSPILQVPPAKQLAMNGSDYLIDLEPGTSIQYMTGGSRISSDSLAQDVIKKPDVGILHGDTYWLLSMGFVQILGNTVCEGNQLLSDLHDLYWHLKNLPHLKDDPNYTFGLVTHPLNFMMDDPKRGGCGLIEEWFRFISVEISSGEINPKTVSDILDGYSTD